ncbi:MAG: rhombosortase [Burkholderiales bacterium]|nr:rhombosortase [Burkholderiales bacterium]MDE2275586.1 rhombosortase [Burkholderiales bacterium]
MAGGLRLTSWLQRPGRAWVTLAAVLALGAALAWRLPAAGLDWQPARAVAQPWRAWTAAFVHWSALHLAVNLFAAAVVGAFGHAARVPARAALAWFAAWPLTHLALALQPALTPYGGLSGVLHAGVALVAVWLVVTGPGARRLIGAAVLAGLVTKLVLERPFGPALRAEAGWDIAVAPLAHFTGSLAGAACAAVALAWHRSPHPRGHRPRQSGA